MHLELTAERLRMLVRYEPDTGRFYALTNTKRKRAGDQLGKANERGYVRVCVDGRMYFAHRLAFLYMEGRWPREQIDHRDGDYGNNVYANLREADAVRNGQNRKVDVRSSTGQTGVILVKRTGNYRAYISVKGARIILGTFASFEDARKARLAAEVSMFGQFRRQR